MTGASSLLAQLASAPGPVRGRFRLVRLPDDAAACVPLALRGGRVSDCVAFTMPMAALDGAGQGAALHFSTALRQRAWRRLQGARGFVPVAMVETRPGSATLLACWLNGAAASPGTLDAVTKIFDDAALRHDLAWAIRAGA